MSRIFTYLKKPQRFRKLILKTSLPKKWSDEKFLKFYYRATHNKNLDLEHPKTFNEKIQWLKLNDRNPEYHLMADKHEAKKIAEKVMGKEHVIPLVGGPWKKFDDIKFDELPEKFVIKCTHDSGSYWICKNKNKINYEEHKKYFDKRLKFDAYKSSREWVYKGLKPQIIAEKYIEDSKDPDLKDYKFFCFNGEPKFFKIDFNRETNHQANYYDIDGNLLPFGERDVPPDFNKKLQMPYNLDKMIEYARIFSKDLYFLRVDFFEVNKHLYFSELTFYPASGGEPLIPEEANLEIGNYLKLPTDKK